MAGPAGQDIAIDVNSSGDTELVAAPGTNRFIRVLHYRLSTAVGGVTTKFKSGSTVKDTIYATEAAGGGIATPEHSTGVFDCGVNEALIINLSAGAAVGGALKYTVCGMQAPTGG